MPVFLRWLLLEIIVVRILRHLRRRSDADRMYRMQTRATGGVRRIYAPAGNYPYARRRRLSGCTGCFVLGAAMTLGMVALIHWAW